MVEQASSSLWDIPVRKIGSTEDQKLGEYAKDKKCVIFVNVASECGLTQSNYTQLVQIYQKYRDQGLEIFGWPCNQFGAQEPKANPDILQFACEKYSADFPLFEKIDVNGPNTHPVYQYLKSNSSLNGGNITWNFAKFIVAPDGRVVHFASPRDEPSSLVPLIEKVLSGSF